MSETHGLTSNLRKQGYRLTPQRRMVLAQVEAAEGHISAEEIFACVHRYYPHLNISTVYRTLELLKELGLVTETDMGDGLVRFHSLAKAHHHHLVCVACGRVTDLNEAELAPLAQAIRQRYSFQADIRHLAIFGRCAACC